MAINKFEVTKERSVELGEFLNAVNSATEAMMLRIKDSIHHSLATNEKNPKHIRVSNTGEGHQPAEFIQVDRDSLRNKLSTKSA